MSVVTTNKTKGEYSLKPFQERYLDLVVKGEMNPTQLASNLGFFSHRVDKRFDTTRAMRLIGLQKNAHYSQRGGRKSQYIRHDVAKQLADALHVDYHEVGI